MIQAQGKQRTATFRVPGLDGMRAVAVLLVMAFHLTPGGMQGGFLGVDVFFVISGYLITALLLRERHASGEIKLSAFWLRRARRLLPGLVLVVVTCTALAVLLGGDSFARLRSQVLGAATFSSNWVFIAQGTDYFTAVSPELFRNFWSLAVEEQFYLIWPILLSAIVLPRRIATTAFALATATLSVLLMSDPQWASNPTRTYFGTDTHAFGLLIGAALAFWTQGQLLAPAGRTTRRALGAVGAAALVGIFALGRIMSEGSSWSQPWGLLTAAILTVIIIAILLVPNNPLARPLKVPVMDWIGKRSYGLYLWHWPVFVLLTAAAARLGVINDWLIGAIALVITVAAAAASYRWVEDPVRRLGFRASWRAVRASFRRPETRRTSIALASLGSVFVALTVTGVIHSQPMSAAEAQIRAGERLVRHNQNLNDVPQALRGPAEDSPQQRALSALTTPQTRLAQAGVKGDVTGSDMLVVGDSVALGAAPAVQQSYPGVLINAEVGRQFDAVLAELRTLSSQGQLRPVVVVEAGTNGTFSPVALAQLRDIIGPNRFLVLVTPFADRPWVPGARDTMISYCQSDRMCKLSRWDQAAGAHTDLLGPDHIHFGPPGAQLWVQTLTTALRS